ncbi:hypothetical protein PMAYCL1PPCAC_22952 [Pristionchus mayeri]|uniref:Uncharacterized protein n=1 Tax=Pristionchus mayeri TaxID=1317129 RepID=A0AAN5CYA2_9BILA|nr:hypothetical protein PMAYCL1PPCAC_22949 [Pristionchus mayeri]GMR52757.1 hypothetical protein PMAYCL1PPCAC_22952 [Pristionchus mayeri]
MSPFNSEDPKYHSCCCGAHVTTCARVLMVVTLFGFVLTLMQGDLRALFSIPVLCLGFYGVFKESRTPLVVYLAFLIIGTFSFIAQLMVQVLTNPKIKDEEMVIPAALIFTSVFLAFQAFVIKSYWNLADFIKDRDAAQQGIYYEGV